MYRQFCTPESWSTDNLASALAHSPTSKKWILLPMFQRSVVWSASRRQLFVDSLKKGFPVGALVMYKMGSSEDHDEYALIDGLQRVSALRDYMTNPTHYVPPDTVPDDTGSRVLTVLGEDAEMLKEVKKFIGAWIYDRKSFAAGDHYTDYDLATALFKQYKCKVTVRRRDQMHNILVPFLEDVQLESNLGGLTLPVLIYEGDKRYLPEIFARLNSQGVQLSKYQVYDASWYSIVVTPKNREIAAIVKVKYDAMIKKDNVSIEGYNPDSATFGKDGLSLSEYLFGLGKWLARRNPELFGEEKDGEEMILRSVGFNLATACLGLEIADMDKLPSVLPSRDMSLFEDALADAVKHVADCLRPFLALNLNSRKSSRSGARPVYHTEYQIVSMVARCFRAKYTPTIELRKDVWKASWNQLGNYLPGHYLFDILADSWRGSGDTKVGTLSADDSQYQAQIPRKSWSRLLDGWFDEEKKRQDKNRNVRDNDELFLRYVYAHKLTAFQDLSPTQVFDIEHIVPIKKLQALRKSIGKEGLPMNAIGNLGLLGTKINGRKQGTTIYEFYDDEVKKRRLTKDKEAKALDPIEQLLFTSRAEVPSAQDLTEGSYLAFLRRRWARVKKEFFVANGI